MAKIIITLQFSPYSTCIKGSWNCTQNECQATCHIYGDGHVRTFDGESYSFDGLCQYTFLEVIMCIHCHNFFCPSLLFFICLWVQWNFIFRMELFFLVFGMFLEGQVMMGLVALLTPGLASLDVWPWLRSWSLRFCINKMCMEIALTSVKWGHSL